MSPTRKTLVDQQEKFYEEPEYANGVEDGDEDGYIVLDEEVSEDGEWIQTRIEPSMIKMESMPDEQPSVEEMIRVRQLVDLLNLEMARQNLDMKPVPCVSQVTIKKTKDTKVVISNPTVYKVPNSDTYIIIGNDAQTGNLSSLLQQPSESESDESESDEDSGSEEEDDVANSESDEVDESGSEEDDVDESGSSDDVDESESEEDDENLSWSEQEDIKLVTNHTGVSKRKAAKALKEFDGDIVTAIMELNSN